MESRQALVEAFETKIGHRLPDDYRQFLLDGPLPYWSEDNEDDESRGNPFTDMLHSFYDLGVDEEDNWRSLDAWFDTRDPNYPEWYLEIGEQFGVGIGLSLSDPNRGRVYSWTWDTAFDPETELAASFGQFLQDLRTQETAWNARRKEKRGPS